MCFFVMVDFPFTVWNVSKYGIFIWSVFSRIRKKAGKYGQEKTPYLDTFHAAFVTVEDNLMKIIRM